MIISGVLITNWLFGSTPGEGLKQCHFSYHLAQRGGPFEWPLNNPIMLKIAHYTKLLSYMEHIMDLCLARQYVIICHHVSKQYMHYLPTISSIYRLMQH